MGELRRTEAAVQEADPENPTKIDLRDGVTTDDQNMADRMVMETQSLRANNSDNPDRQPGLAPPRIGDRSPSHDPTRSVQEPATQFVLRGSNC